MDDSRNGYVLNHSSCTCHIVSYRITIVLPKYW